MLIYFLVFSLNFLKVKEFPYFLTIALSHRPRGTARQRTDGGNSLVFLFFLLLLIFFFLA